MLVSGIGLVVIAALIVCLSSWGVLSPARLASFVRTFMHRPGSMAFAVGIRVVLAAALWTTAPGSHTPVTFKVLAGLAVAGALGIAIAGSERISRLLDYVASWPRSAIRLQCLLGVAFGLFLFWSGSPLWAAT